MKPNIYLIDVDGTLTKEVCYTPKECLEATPNLNVIKWVNEKHHTNYIIICTARRHILYEATIEWLKLHNVSFHATSFESKPPGIIVDLDAINKIGE